MIKQKDEIIIYNTEDGKTNVKLYAQDGMIWMNQQQIALLFESSKQNISLHIANIFNDKELDEKSVVKNYLTTASDGKNYEITYYALPMILAIGFRVRTMLYWKENFDKILVDNGFLLLNDKGIRSHQQMEKKVESIYLEFDAKRKTFYAAESDKSDSLELAALENLEKQLKAKK